MTYKVPRIDKPRDPESMMAGHPGLKGQKGTGNDCLQDGDPLWSHENIWGLEVVAAKQHVCTECH